MQIAEKPTLDPQWRSEIEQASSEAALVALARRYLLRRQGEVVANLPGIAPLPRLLSSGDVSLATYRLRRLYCSPALETIQAPFVEHAVAFFDALCERIFELRFQEDSRQRRLPPLMSARE